MKKNSRKEIVNKVEPEPKIQFAEQLVVFRIPICFLLLAKRLPSLLRLLGVLGKEDFRDNLGKDSIKESICKKVSIKALFDALAIATNLEEKACCVDALVHHFVQMVQKVRVAVVTLTQFFQHLDVRNELELYEYLCACIQARKYG